MPLPTGRFPEDEVERAHNLTDEQLEWFLYINQFERRLHKLSRMVLKAFAGISVLAASYALVDEYAIHPNTNQNLVVPAVVSSALGAVCYGMSKSSEKLLNGDNHETRVLLTQEAFDRNEQTYTELVYGDLLLEAPETELIVDSMTIHNPQS